MGAQTSQTAFLPIPVIRDAKIKSFASKRPDERRSEALRHPLNAIVAAAVVIRSIVVYSHAMEITHAHLQETVKEQIDSYVVPEHHSDAVGSAMPRSWFSDRLDEMRAAVVSPVPVRMHDVDDKTGDLVTLNVLIVVDDKQGTLVGPCALFGHRFTVAV